MAAADEGRARFSIRAQVETKPVVEADVAAETTVGDILARVAWNRLGEADGCSVWRAVEVVACGCCWEGWWPWLLRHGSW